ncbi:50S ribosomal protein L6 [Reticulomyxa filosa]|uniref:50S ribosomal protein L6 n=1 Tax=Reticulomyxa filosa TaxID=46433 RepID=X6PA35_RETFI|nr:50S ribosomal protein L6 [Reticulomyxa filosa]|eukprot:ETO34512.1 50S ribosomal protein L6 [Reticulomyxa filosa]
MTTSASIKSMIYGVTCGWEKRLRLLGKGYRATLDDKDKRKLILRCGYRQPVEVWAPIGSSFQVLEGDDTGIPIIVRGMDIEQVGNIAAALKRIKKLNKQGQGIRYDKEVREIKSKKGKR